MTTALLLLLASQTPDGGAFGPRAGELDEAGAIAKARALAERLGMRVDAVRASYSRSVREEDRLRNPPAWSVELSPAGTYPNATLLTLRAGDGAVLGLYDGTARSRPVPGWSPRLPRAAARAKMVQYARRTFAFPADWQVVGGSFEAVRGGSPGTWTWPKSAQVWFEDRPFGYRYLVGGNSARLSVDPRMGSLRSWSYSDGTTVERAAIRLRADQAATVARRYRVAERRDARPRVRGLITLGWAPVPDADGKTGFPSVQRLVYAVPFFGETHWVDANNGRILGSRRTR